MSLKIWYDQWPANDLGPGDPAIVVHTVAQLDSFVDRVLREARGRSIPPMIEVSVDGSQELRVLEVGLGPARGFVNFVARDGGRTFGDPALTGSVTYDCMGSPTDIDASAEIPLATVRQGLREFLESGGAKPSSLSWE